MEDELDDRWILCVDGSSSFSKARARVVLMSSGENIANYALCFNFPVTNNEVEYEALIANLKITQSWSWIVYVLVVIHSWWWGM